MNNSDYNDPEDWAASLAVNELKSQWQQTIEENGGVYLEIIEDNGYLIEIEVSEGDIAASYGRIKGLEKAKEAAKSIKTILTKHGIHVFTTREEWEEALEDFSGEN